MSVGDGAALSAQRPPEQHDGKQQEENLGGANGSQFRDPNARHERSNLQLSSFYPLGRPMDELMQRGNKMIWFSHGVKGSMKFW